MRRTVLLLVIALAGLWPFAHAAVVARYDVDPWKLGGWAMYTRPSPPLLVALFTKVGGGFQPIPESSLPRPALAELESFRRERHALGKLREPRKLGIRTLEGRSDLSSVIVVVQKARLDNDTATMHLDRVVFEYDRAASLR